MKKQRTLILVGVAMSLTMVTGCKHSSKSVPESVVKPNIIKEMSPEQTKMEIAVQLKANSEDAKEKLQEAVDSLKDAKNYRDQVKEARDLEGSSIIREMLSKQVEASIKEVQILEKNVEALTNLLIAERKLLLAALKDLSTEDQAKLGEAEFEAQMVFDEKKAREEMALEAARELTRSAEVKIQELSKRLQDAEDRLAQLEANQAPQQFVEAQRRSVKDLVKDIEDANKKLNVLIAQEDNLAELFNQKFN